jgi:hypothetical protein
MAATDLTRTVALAGPGPATGWTLCWGARVRSSLAPGRARSDGDVRSDPDLSPPVQPPHNLRMADSDGEPGPVPGLEDARALSTDLLGDLGTRLAHVLTAGRIAQAVGARLVDAGKLDPVEAHLLGVAATVHDIGYSPRIRRTGFHPLDGGLHLAELGWSLRLCGLVANHSCALATAPESVRAELIARFPADPGLLADALAYSDMHSSPSGTVISVEERLADVALRHPDPRQDVRAAQLRTAIARVGQAMEASVPGAGVSRSGEPPAGTDDEAVSVRSDLPWIAAS